MDYKQEAERIMDLFFHEVLHYDVEFGHQLAKACAAICVQEIISFLESDDHKNSSYYWRNSPELENWNKVLEHIKQL